jgi:CBS domain-containing protein
MNLITIDQILNDKGHEIISVRADHSLLDTAKVLEQKRIGAVVALDEEGGLIGVLSERDITRQVARNGAAALETDVGSAMTRQVVTVPPTTTVDSALQLMTEKRIRHLPVVEGNEIVGFVSIGDLVKWKVVAAEAEAEAMKSYLSTQY